MRLFFVRIFILVILKKIAEMESVKTPFPHIFLQLYCICIVILLCLLRTLMNRSVDSVIIATDAGREDELIGRLVYEQAGCTKPMQRLWLMSLEDSAIREGFNNLRPSADFDDLYHAALCRAKADYMVGINATRLFTCLYQEYFCCEG